MRVPSLDRIIAHRSSLLSQPRLDTAVDVVVVAVVNVVVSMVAAMGAALVVAITVFTVVMSTLVLPRGTVGLAGATRNVITILHVAMPHGVLLCEGGCQEASSQACYQRLEKGIRIGS